MENDIELAAALHGHLSPGVALGLKMGWIGLKLLGLKKGDKRLFAIVETPLCLADGIQAATGCTIGHASLRVEDFGKIAACIARSDTKMGVRLSLRQDKLPQNVIDWATRKRKLSHEEEKTIVNEIMGLDEAAFTVERVFVEPFFSFEISNVIKCDECGEWVLENRVIRINGRKLCKSCSRARYYNILSTP
ncbi:MAG: FmdE family protein [Candidatus Bathyarchaeia archaeon]